ncbi:MAG: hypothetical protein ACPHK8_05910 [Thermoplasmatota archaeon]
MDERPLKIIKRIEDEAPRQAWHEVATTLLQHAENGKELQFEFGPEHVSFITGCNQFLRIYKSGPHAGTGEILPGPGFDLDAGEAVGGMVFKMFGWKHVKPQPGLDAAVLAAYESAAAKQAPK